MRRWQCEGKKGIGENKHMGENVPSACENEKTDKESGLWRRACELGKENEFKPKISKSF